MTREQAWSLRVGDRVRDTQIGWVGEFQGMHTVDKALVVWDGYKSVWFIEVGLMGLEEPAASVPKDRSQKR